MIDTFIKTGLFFSIAWLLDFIVYRATGAPLHESLWWSVRHLGEVHKPILFFGMLVSLIFMGFTYGISKDLYQSLVSSKQAALYLGYHTGQEHYLIDDDGAKRSVAINRPGPGEFRFNQVFQPASIMYNRLSQLYWPLKETNSTPIFLLLAGLMLVFTLATLGTGHIHYLDKIRPELLAVLHAGDLNTKQYVPVFMKALFSYLAAHPAPLAFSLAVIVGGLAFQMQRLSGESSLAKRSVPAAIKPGAVLTATLVDTYFKTESKHRSNVSNYGFDVGRTLFYAIFEINGIYPHPVWLATYLGSDKPAAKDNGAYEESLSCSSFLNKGRAFS